MKHYKHLHDNDKSIDLIFSLLHFQRSTALSQIHCSLIVKENGRQINKIHIKLVTQLQQQKLLLNLCKAEFQNLDEGKGKEKKKREILNLYFKRGVHEYFCAT